jgi:hypothetical protein
MWIFTRSGLKAILTLADLSALLSRMIKKEFVELGPRHLIRAVEARTEAILEIKFCFLRSTCRHDLSAVFWQESAIKFFAHAEAVESLGAEWQKRFTDMNARKFFALEDDHTPARLRQKGRGRAAGWSSANDGDIVRVGLHAVFMIANSSDIGRDNTARRLGRRSGASPIICANLSLRYEVNRPVR